MFLRNSWYVAAWDREIIPILEAQQRNLEFRPDAPRIDIKVDAAPLAARRMLETMIKREADAATCGVRAG